MTVNLALAPALTVLSVSSFILLTYHLVPEQLHIGEFITGIGIWRTVGSCYQDIYASLIDMQDAINPLCNVSFYMNLQTDVHRRMDRSRWLIGESRAAGSYAQERLSGKTSTSERPDAAVTS